MESYRVIFTGNRTIQYQDIPLAEHLATLPFSEQAIEKLSSGKAIALQQNASLSDAIASQNKYKQLGLITYLTLKLSPDCLHAGLKNYSNDVIPTQVSIVSTTVDAQKTATPEPASDSSSPHPELSEIRIVDKQALSPLIAAQPKKYTIHDNKGHTSHSLSLDTFKFGSLLLLPLCVLFALDLQIYILQLLTSAAGLRTAATMLSLVFLLAMVMCAPKIMQPLNRMTLKCTDTNKELVLVDIQTAYIGKTVYNCETINGAKQGRISISQNAASFESKTKIFRWDAKLRLGDINAEALTNMQNAALDNTSLSAAMGALYSLKKLNAHFGPKTDSEISDWDQQPRSAIVDAKDQVIAIIYSGTQPAYRILDQNQDRDLCLSAFCISVLGKRLV